MHDPMAIGFEPRSRAFRTAAKVHGGPVDAAGLHSAAPIPSYEYSKNSPSRTRRSSFVPTSEEMANLFEVAFTEADDTPDRGSARHGHRDALLMATPSPRLVQVQRAALAAAGELEFPSPLAVGEVTSAEHQNEAQSDLPV